MIAIVGAAALAACHGSQRGQAGEDIETNAENAADTIAPDVGQPIQASPSDKDVPASRNRRPRGHH